MRKAVNSRTRTACLPALLILAVPCYADVEDRIARCTHSDSTQERIDCLEDSLRELAGEHVAEDAPGAEPGPAAEQVAPDRLGDEPVLGAEQVRPGQSGDAEEPRVRATVVDFRFVGYRRLMVELDNGQVWRQIDGDRTSVERGLRNTETFDVDMWGTKLGGYRMHILPLGRTLRVERLR